MIKQQAIVTKIEIAKAGQVKHFQVALPKNAKQITGIETGCSITGNGTSPIPVNAKVVFVRSVLIGELKLQSCEEANIFYGEHIRVDNNLWAGDFSRTEYWKPMPFTHQGKSEEERIVVDGDSTIIQGIYKDCIGEQSKQDLAYKVSVVVWVEAETI